MKFLLFLFLPLAVYLIVKIRHSHKEKENLNKIQSFTPEQLREFFHKEKLEYLQPHQMNVHNAINYESRRQQLRKLKKAKVKTVRQLGVKDGRDCDDAKKNNGKIYSINKTPKLPCINCDAEICRCAFVADTFYDD